MTPRYRGLLFLLLLLALGACSSPSAVSTNDAATTEAKPIPIRIFAQQDAGQDLRSNDFTALMEKQFHIAFNWETVPYDGAKEKRQISLASGNYPDVYMLTAYIDQFSRSELLRYGKQGVFLPLNALIDRYAPHIKAALAENAELRAMNTAPDGQIYGLTSYTECFHCAYPNKMWLNTVWLNKLHLDMPTTTAQFKRVLEAFKTQDPNGNGLADEVPLSGSTEDFGVHVIPFLMNGFIYDDDHSYLLLNDGRVDLASNKPAWREGLAYIKSLYTEGLIDPGAFTQSSEAYKRLGDNGQVEILGAGAGMHPQIFVESGAGGIRSKDYNPVPPLQGPHANYAVYTGNGTLPGAKFVITNKASPEAQIALIQMVDYMFTPEGQIQADSGKEGVGWRRPLPGEEALGPGTTPEFASIFPLEGARNNTGWVGTGHFYMPLTYRNSWVQSKDIYSPDGYERRLYEATLLYAGKEPKTLFPFWELWADSAEADQTSMLETNLKNYIDQNALQFITGDKDLDQDWEAYVAGLDQMGLPRYLDLMQKSYDHEQQQKLQKP